MLEKRGRYRLMTCSSVSVRFARKRNHKYHVQISGESPSKEKNYADDLVHITLMMGKLGRHVAE